MVFFLHPAPVIGHARKLLRVCARLAAFARARVWRGLGLGGGHLQIRVALVVPKQYVVLGIERLDEVVFEQQRLGFGAHHGGFHAHNFAHHMPDARAAMVFLKVAGDPLFQADGFAHVEHLVLRIKVAVHTGQGRQSRNLAQQRFAMDGGVGRSHGGIVRAFSVPGVPRLASPPSCLLKATGTMAL